MKCKRRKAVFGIDDMAIAAIIGSLISAGTSLYGAKKQKDIATEQIKNQNILAANQQSMINASNYDKIANSRDYIDERQNDIVLHTRNNNQFNLGGYKDRFVKSLYGMRKRN